MIIYPSSRKTANARVVELADSLDSGSSVHSGRAGSSPASRTKLDKSRVLLELYTAFAFSAGESHEITQKLCRMATQKVTKYHLFLCFISWMR